RRPWLSCPMGRWLRCRPTTSALRTTIMALCDPITKSLDTYNSYRVDCKPVGRTQSYKLCLHIIDAFDRGVIEDRFPECQACFAADTCAAQRMREEEEKAGACLYYLESPLKALHEAQDNPQPVE